MDIKELRSFEAVYIQRSITRAAKSLYISPQGLSKSIQNLESELGVPLFVRSSHGVIPTPAADFLHEHAQSLIAKMEVIQQHIQQLGTDQPRLRIGCACGVFNLLPLQRVLDFAQDNRSVLLEWREYSIPEIKKLLSEGKLDFGMIVGEWNDPEVITHRMKSCQIYLLVYEGHPLYERNNVSVDMLRNEPLIVLNEDFNIFHQINDACTSRGFTPNFVARTADAPLLYTLCGQQIGLAIVPGFTIGAFNMNHLRTIPFQEDFRWTVYVVYSKRNENSLILQKLTRYLEDCS